MSEVIEDEQAPAVVPEPTETTVAEEIKRYRLTNSQKTLEELIAIGKIVESSRMFPSARSCAEAVVKMLIGQELGIPPMAALRGIDMVEGHPEIRAHLLSALVRTTTDYDFKIETLDEVECLLSWWNKDPKGEWVQIGTSTFTYKDAETAGLLGKANYKKYPKDMFYNRAVARGVRMFCSHLVYGAVYVEGEISDDRPAPAKTPDFGGKKLQAKITQRQPPKDVSDFVINNGRYQGYRLSEIDREELTTWFNKHGFKLPANESEAIRTYLGKTSVEVKRKQVEALPAPAKVVEMSIQQHKPQIESVLAKLQRPMPIADKVAKEVTEEEMFPPGESVVSDSTDDVEPEWNE